MREEDKQLKANLKENETKRSAKSLNLVVSQKQSLDLQCKYYFEFGKGVYNKKAEDQIYINKQNRATSQITKDKVFDVA